MTKRTFRVTETREAMEVTADNLEEVAAWCGGTAERVDLPDGTVSEFVDYESVDGLVPVHPGDVLITDGSRWWDVPREEFDRHAAQWEETSIQDPGRSCLADVSTWP